jgi:hypothetical protein
VEHDSSSLKLSSDATQFSKIHWGPLLRWYLRSIDRISNAKWLRILAQAKIFVEPEPEPIEIDSSEESDMDEHGNIAPSSP